MKKIKGSLSHKAMAVMLSAVLFTGLISGAAPVRSKAEERSFTAAGTSVKRMADEADRDSLTEILPVVNAPAELEADATSVVPLPRELEEEILEGTTVDGIGELELSDYTLTASYDPDMQLCTVVFALTESGNERFRLGAAAVTTAKCRVRFRIAKKEITPLLSVPEKMEFDAAEGIISERDIETELLKKVSVGGIDLLEPADYIVGAVYDKEKGACTVSFTLSPEGGEKYVLGESAITTAECGIIIRRQLSDAVSTKIEKDAAAPDLQIVTGLPALADAILSAAEKEEAQTGTDISFVFSIRDIGNTISSADTAALSRTLEGYQTGQYLDINLFKEIGEERSQITKTAGKIRLTFTLPETLTGQDKNVTREFAVVRVHDGETAVLQDLDTDPASVTVDTDCFSVYAIVYKDSAGTGSTGTSGTGEDEKGKSPVKTDNKKETATTGKNSDKTVTDSSAKNKNERAAAVVNYGRNGGEDAPETGDPAPLEFYATIAMISGFTYVLLLFKSDRCGMTEERKKELVSQIIRWACRGGKFRQILAYGAIVLLLVYYHSIGKKTETGLEGLASK